MYEGVQTVPQDEPILLISRSFISRRFDMRLLSALNGKSGLDIAWVSQPEVIVMDINLPDISGFKALEILRSDPTTVHIPVQETTKKRGGQQ